MESALEEFLVLREVVRVQVHPSDCDELWVSCERFGFAAKATAKT